MSLSAQEHEARMRLYKLGYSDQHIADELNYSYSTIKAWRNKYNLPSNYGLGGYRPGSGRKFKYA